MLQGEPRRMWAGPDGSGNSGGCNQSLKRVLGFLCCLKHVQVPCRGGSESPRIALQMVLAFLETWGQMIFLKKSYTFVV